MPSGTSDTDSQHARRATLPNLAVDACTEMGVDIITVACAQVGFNLAKVVRADWTIQDYDRVTYYSFHPYPLKSLREVGGLLSSLLPDSGCAVVRGSIADPARTSGVRRLLHDDPTKGAKTLRDVPRRWLALDVDSLALPPGVAVQDIAACARACVAAMPAELHAAQCVGQATAGHGIKAGIRMRLWYWLGRPVSGMELRRWFAKSPVDTAVFGAAQLIFTAAPIFLGRADHLPHRLVYLPGNEMVVVPPVSVISPPRPRRPQIIQTFSTTAEGRDFAHVALIRAAQRILDAPEGERHRTLVRECCKLVPLLRSGALTEATAREVIVQATAAAGWDRPDKIDGAISWAFARPVAGSFKDIADA